MVEVPRQAVRACHRDDEAHERQNDVDHARAPVGHALEHVQQRGRSAAEQQATPRGNERGGRRVAQVEVHAAHVHVHEVCFQQEERAQEACDGGDGVH